MLRKMFTYGGVLLFAGAVVVATPSLGQAQHGGGGHGGGGGGAHFSGGHMGGAHFGGGSMGGARFGGGSMGGARFGGFRGSGFRYSYPHTYYSPHYGSYHYRPYYNSYYYPYYNTYPYVSSSPMYDSGYYGSSADVTPSYSGDYVPATPPAGSYQSFYPAATAQPDTSAHLTVNLPADARLWFGDTATTSTGPVRQFYSPPLTPGTQYSYELRASWNENGREVTQTQKVDVTAGAFVRVDFPVPSGTAEQASTTNGR